MLAEIGHSSACASAFKKIRLKSFKSDFYMRIVVLSRGKKLSDVNGQVFHIF